MTRPRTYQTEAIVIKKTKLGEADRILTLYTPDLGKIQAVAKGVRRAKAKLAGHLELLTYTQISLARGHNMDTVIGSQTIDSFLSMKNDLWLTSCGLYAAELVNQFTTEGSEDRALFQLLVQMMQRLCQGGDAELALRYFELTLLRNAGYRPQLRECVACRQPLQPVANYFCPRSGGVLCPQCGHSQYPAYPVSVNALKVLRLLDESEFDVVPRIKMHPELSDELEMLLRHYIRYLLERDVKSVTWLDDLRRRGNPVAPEGFTVGSTK